MGHQKGPHRRAQPGRGNVGKGGSGLGGDLRGARPPVGGGLLDDCPRIPHEVMVEAMSEEAIFGPLLEELRRAERPTLSLHPDPVGPGPEAVALLSGSFDPMTVAHAQLAEAARARAGLVVLVYSVRTLAKEGPAPPPLLPERDRLDVLMRFCRARDGIIMGLCSHGLLAEHVTAARERFPGSELFLVMGSDKVLQVLDPKWYEDRERVLRDLFGAAGVLYAVRAGDEGRVEEALARPENERWRGRFAALEVDPTAAAVSSRLVREELRQGRAVRHLVPAEAHHVLERPRIPGGNKG